MHGPDGPEERTADLAERFDAEFDALMFDGYERDIDDADVADNLEVTLVTQVPVRCVVYSHDWHPKTHYCRRCGQDRNDEVGQTRVWL